MASASQARKRLVSEDAAQKSRPEEEKKRLTPETFINLDVRDSGGRPFVGKFRYHVPNLGQLIEIGKLKALLSAGQVLAANDRDSASLVEMMSYLEVTIDHVAPGTPSWWAESDHGSKLFDALPLKRLYEEARLYEDRFHGGDAGARRDQKIAAKSKDDEGTGPLREDAVEQDVPRPSDRRIVLAGDGAGSDGDDSSGEGTGGSDG